MGWKCRIRTISSTPWRSRAGARRGQRNDHAAAGRVSGLRSRFCCAGARGPRTRGSRRTRGQNSPKFERTKVVLVGSSRVFRYLRAIPRRLFILRHRGIEKAGRKLDRIRPPPATIVLRNHMARARALCCVDCRFVHTTRRPHVRYKWTVSRGVHRSIGGTTLRSAQSHKSAEAQRKFQHAVAGGDRWHLCSFSRTFRHIPDVSRVAIHRYGGSPIACRAAAFR